MWHWVRDTAGTSLTQVQLPINNLDFEYFRPTRWLHQKPHRKHVFWLPIFWTAFWDHCSIFFTNFGPGHSSFFRFPPCRHQTTSNVGYGPHGEQINNPHLVQVIFRSDQMRELELSLGPSSPVHFQKSLGCYVIPNICISSTTSLPVSNTS